jgi:uridylate cyclase
MGLSDDIESGVETIVGAAWNIRSGNIVPKTDDVALANAGVKLDAVYLYADMADSTGLARDFTNETAARVVRAYLDATCRVIRARGGEIRSFDGDRVMAIFVGDSKNSTAAKCGLQIAHVVQKIVRPAVESRLPSIRSKGYQLEHCVGIASGKALVVRGGVRGSNDLVSIGRAPNIAAKLSEVRMSPHRTYLTEGVFNMLNADSKYGGSPRSLMWETRTREVGGERMSVYRSSWTSKP